MIDGWQFQLISFETTFKKQWSIFNLSMIHELITKCNPIDNPCVYVNIMTFWNAVCVSNVQLIEIGSWVWNIFSSSKIQI